MSSSQSATEKKRNKKAAKRLFDSDSISENETQFLKWISYGNIDYAMVLLRRFPQFIGLSLERASFGKDITSSALFYRNPEYLRECLELGGELENIEISEVIEKINEDIISENPSYDVERLTAILDILSEISQPGISIKPAKQKL
jgi:hypothetical protein